MPKLPHIACDYCGKTAKLVKGSKIYVTRNEKTANKHFWFCAPCEAWVGCYENSPTFKPLGRLADAKLRAARRDFHDAFDVLWLAGFERLSRIHGNNATKHDCIRIGYHWLAERMAIKVQHCNIGVFDLLQCERATKICETLGNELLARYKNEGGGE